MMKRAIAIATLAVVAACDDRRAAAPAAGRDAAIAARPPAPRTGRDPAKPPATSDPPPRDAAMTPAQATAVIDEAVARVEQPSPPCDRIADALSAALPVAFPGSTQAALPALRALARCAGQTHRWRAAVQAGVALVRLGDRDDKLPAAVVRALAEMGEYDKAIRTAGELAARLPRSRPLLAAALTFAYCRAEAWDRCVKAGDTALDQLVEAGIDPASDGALINRLLRDVGWIVTGKPKQALADIEAVERARGALPYFAQAKLDARRALARGFHLEVVPLVQLPTGVYHLMGRKDTGALVTVKLRDHTATARRFRVEVEVPGVTDAGATTIELGRNAGTVAWVNPPLRRDFDPSKIRGQLPSQLEVKVIELIRTAELVVLDETIEVEVLPREYLPLRRRVGADSLIPTHGYLSAWLTPNDQAVGAALAAAKQRVAGRSFAGEQGATVPQIEALFDELAARDVSYVMDPDVTSELSFVQRVRLPAEVLASTRAHCLEATLLFATLIEAIGIEPIIVLVPGHAFVGWRTTAGDGAERAPRFVETTLVGRARFEDAMQLATRRVAREVAAGSFESGAATRIDVAALRAAGFTAPPR